MSQMTYQEGRLLDGEIGKGSSLKRDESEGGKKASGKI